MFVTKKRYDSDLKNIEYDYKELRHKYYELLGKYELILNHLGVMEQTIPGRTELVVKK